MKIDVSPLNGRIVPSSAGRALEQPQRCRADGNDAAAGAPRGVQRIGSLCGDDAPLRVHLVIGRVVGLDRQECAGTDMQRQAPESAPFARTAASSSGVKCRPAVGAATAPSSRANMVW